MTDKQSEYQKILQDMEQACERLPLCTKPDDIVMGFGSIDSDVMFIGEAPGQNEAIQRKPFVGRAGQLLNQTLQEHGMKRDDFYVSNIVKVRPPNNRDPFPAEIDAFVPYLHREIELIKPLLFVTLGRFSMNFFLPEAKISAVHGSLQRFWWEGSITYLLPVYHPAAALRNGTMRTAFAEDIGKIPKAIELIKQKKAHDTELEVVRASVF